MSDSSPQPRTTTEEIAGLVERVTFFSPESGFAVLRVKVRGERDLVTVLGSVPTVSAGEWVTAKGWWVRDKEHGLQFKAQVLKATPPTTREGARAARTLTWYPPPEGVTVSSQPHSGGAQQPQEAQQSRGSRIDRYVDRYAARARGVVDRK